MDECMHGLIGCATCEGLDEGSPGEGYAGEVQPWSADDLAVAADMTLSSRDVAVRLGRKVNAVSAKRTASAGKGGLDMAGYPRWVSHGRQPHAA